MLSILTPEEAESAEAESAEAESAEAESAEAESAEAESAEAESAEAESAELKGLMELPSVGVLWPGSSGVGYSLKYAYRLAMPDGGERITFITGRPVGAFAREPWRAVDEPNPPVTGYTVIELRLDADGNGEGRMSLAADVVFDTEAGTVALDNYETTPVLLEAVTREPPPYWARGD